MPVFNIPNDICQKNIEEIGFHPETLAYLQKHGYKTVYEVIVNKEKIKEKYLTNIKAKLIFGLDLAPK